MSWYLLALFAAFFQAVHDLVSKKSLSKIRPEMVAFGNMVTSAFFLVPLLLIQGLPELEEGVIYSLLLVCFLDAVGAILFFRSLSAGDLSLALPLKMFTPFFLLFTSPIMLGEYASVTGVIGVLLIIGGSYVLNIAAVEHGPLAPIKALLKNRSSQLMLMYAAVASIICNLHKVVLEGSSPLFYATAHQILCAAFIMPLFLAAPRKAAKEFCSEFTSLLIIGLSVVFLLLCFLGALESGLVVYVVSIKRTSVLMGIVASYFFLKEGGFRERLTGAGIMVSGAIVTAL